MKVRGTLSKMDVGSWENHDVCGHDHKKPMSWGMTILVWKIHSQFDFLCADYRSFVAWRRTPNDSDPRPQSESSVCCKKDFPFLHLREIYCKQIQVNVQ